MAGPACRHPRGGAKTGASGDEPRWPVRRFGLVVAGVAVFVVLSGTAFAFSRTSATTGPPQLTVTAALMSVAAEGDDAALYVTIANAGGADGLVGATTPAAASVSIHGTEEIKGGAIMHDVDRLKVPATGELVLRPGENHLMLERTPTAMVAGDQVPVTLHFERSPPMTVTADVVSYVDLAALLATNDRP